MQDILTACCIALWLIFIVLAFLMLMYYIKYEDTTIKEQKTKKEQEKERLKREIREEIISYYDRAKYYESFKNCRK